MKRARVCRTLILLTVLLVGPARGASGADWTRQLDSLFVSLPHAAFEWTSADGVSDRAAMRVPVDLDGARGWFQVDTGLDATVVYGGIPVERKWEVLEGKCLAPGLRIGGIRMGPVWLCAGGNGPEGDMLGSLGLDLLVGRLVVIDYPGRRLAIMQPGDAPPWLLRQTSWTPAVLRDGKFFLTAVLGGEDIDGLFFDTGASAFNVTVDFGTWKALTGCTGPDSATTRWAVSSWGNEVTAIGCAARGPLVIGSARIPDPPVFYIKEQPNLFSGWPFPATGLVGNAPFWDRVVILDLGIRPRFGLVDLGAR